ncbi:MAG TPA: DUF2784 family protein [bacterium]|nr:DUF2784 family protein [bacterium]
MRIFLLSIHSLWVLWMVAGVLLAILGFRYPRVWTWKHFRILHLAAIIATASVPLWNRGACPLTEWEAALAAEPVAQPFLARVLTWLVYWDIPLWLLSLSTGVAAIVTLVVFVLHPPWRCAGRR